MNTNQDIPKDRAGQIKHVLKKLKQIKETESDAYAVEQNILFFEAVQSIPRYIKWLYGTRRAVLRENLLEINEILPELDEEFHSKMAVVERQPRPGIVKPVVDFVCSLVHKESKNERFRIASFGSGSMEAERQSIERLHTERFDKPITIVGFDTSKNTREYAYKNISSLAHVRVVAEDFLTEERMFSLEKETTENVLVIISGNDIFSLNKVFQPATFSLAMTALFLHHLPTSLRADIVSRMRELAPHTLNYDGYRNEIVLPLISVTGWGTPVFLNAAIFSSIRFNSKASVLKLHDGAEISFYKHGHYLAVYSKK